MEKYEELKCIGRGSYGSAHLVALRGSGERFVVKKIPTELLTDKEKAQAFREVELLAKLKHPNVVEYRENFVEDNVIHIVMAYCDGGDLADKIRERVALLEQLVDADRTRAYFDTSQILDWFVQMAMAIKYLHQQRILHRDLKTSNIFLTTENVIKLGDFGIAKTLDSTLDQAKTVVGTPYYMSPEVCENKPYSYSSDVWSLGCVLYEMCALRHAFDAPNIISLIFTIVRNEFAPVPKHFDSEISSLIKRLLDKSPENRPSMDQIFAIPYIRNHMQGLVASGGSLRVNPVARRQIGVPKKRLHVKNMMMRRSSIDGGRRKSRSSTAAATSATSAGTPQWIPITPFEADERRSNEQNEDDLELLGLSSLEESQLDLRAPERSRTPEPLVCSPDESKPPPVPLTVLRKPPFRHDQRQGFAVSNKPATAWTETTQLLENIGAAATAAAAYKGVGDDEVEEEEEDIEEDAHSKFQAEAEELMNPNFENEYSEECMDSRQIYYRSRSAKAKGRREGGRFRSSPGQLPSESSQQVGQLSSPVVFRPRSTPTPLAGDSMDALGDEEEDEDHQQQHSVVMKRFPLHVDDSIDYDEPADPSSVAAYEQWGRFAAHDDVTLQLEDTSLDADNVEMHDSLVSDDDGGGGGSILPRLQLNEDEHSSDDDYDGDDYNDSGDDDEGEDYTSMSEYDVEENFYSDDSDFFEENGTQYSDDFEDGDAEVIEYANDEFSADDASFSSSTGLTASTASSSAPVADASAAAAGAGAAGTRPELLMSPADKRQQKPPTEVQWVMRNVAQSLLQSHDDLTVA